MWDFFLSNCIYVHTLPLKSLLPLASLCSKITLNTGEVGGTLKLKNKDIFFYVLGTSYANFQQFPIKWSSGKLSNKHFHFYCSKNWQFLFESSSRSSILLEIAENWHTKCQGLKKRCPHFSSLMVYPCPSHTACI